VRGAVAELGLDAAFDAIVSGDEVARGKPAPDVYLEAARRLAVPASRCVAIEDSGPGIAAARAAGMATVAIPHPVSRTHDFSGALLQVTTAADLTVDTLQRLVESAR
jgi:beta-phosphoglucomutase-like phosphatase (HAD superfamily)